MIELRLLRYAIMAADQQSFSRAATAFSMKQSTLSRKVLRLEDQLGFQLFERTTRGVYATALARPFLESARQILGELDGLQVQAQALRKGSRARLALGYSGSLFEGPHAQSITTFLRRYPDIQFDGFERAPQRLVEALRAGIVDAIIAPCCTGCEDFTHLPVWSAPLRVCISRQHRLARVDPIEWPDLKNEQFLLPVSGLGPVIRDLLIRQLAEFSGHLQISLQDTGVDNIVGLVSMTDKATLMVQSVPSHALGMVYWREVGGPSDRARIDFALHWCKGNSNPALERFRNIVCAESVQALGSASQGFAGAEAAHHAAGFID